MSSIFDRLVLMFLSIHTCLLCTVLDKVRCELGEFFTKNHSYRKGKIMLEIEKKRSYNKVVPVPSSVTDTVPVVSESRYER